MSRVVDIFPARTSRRTNDRGMLGFDVNCTTDP